MSLTVQANAQTTPNTTALMQQANAGNPVAEYNLAGAYFHGKGGLPRDPAKAVYWFKKSAAQGYPRAEYSLGSSYYRGLGGLPRDPAKAVYWFKKSAAQGDPSDRKSTRLNSSHAD